jgi:hypothetical protein
MSAIVPGSANLTPGWGQTNTAANPYETNFTNPTGGTQVGVSPLGASQIGLQNAQAGAVHDALQGVQLTEGDKMSRFNSILPLLSNQFSNLNKNFATAGGANGTPPPITAGPVLNDQQIQQQVNQSTAATNQGAQSQMQQSDSSLAGRGFGANSPLSMALNNATQNSARATNASNETNTRLNAAQQNAGQLLNSQQALSNQYATVNQLDIQRRAPIYAQQNALIAALGGLV